VVLGVEAFGVRHDRHGAAERFGQFTKRIDHAVRAQVNPGEQQRLLRAREQCAGPSTVAARTVHELVWVESGALLQLDFPVNRMISRPACCGVLRWPVHGVALDRYTVGVLDGAEPGGDPGFAGGDGLAVAAAVGAFGQVLAEAFDFADVGFALVGVSGDGEHGGVSGGGVEDEADHLGFGVAAGQGEDPGAVGLGPGLFGDGVALPGSVVEVCEYLVGSVELVAGGGEVLADRAELGAAVVAVFQEPGGLGLVGVVA
jgi:hypothetical protein